MEEESAGDGPDGVAYGADAGAGYGADYGAERVRSPQAVSPSYPPPGQLVSALANHFSQGFDANFIEDSSELFAAYSSVKPSHELSQDSSQASPVDRAAQLHAKFAATVPVAGLSESGPLNGATKGAGRLRAGFAERFQRERFERESFGGEFSEELEADSDLAEDGFAADGLRENGLDEGLLGGAFNERLARQFSGEPEGDPETDSGAYDDGSLSSRPIGLRGLQWIRRNMTSLRVIVSLQRVTPPDAGESRHRRNPRD